MSARSNNKPKNQRLKRVFEHKASKLVENVKRSLVLKGSKCSNVVSQVLTDLHMLKKPHSKTLQKKNPYQLFEEHAAIEFLGQKNDCSLFFFGSHSKKRPHNLILGRLFDFQLLDMIELGVNPNTCKSIKEFSKGRTAAVKYDCKPLIVFNGPEFESNTEYALFKNLIVDIFRGEVIPKVNLASLSQTIVCTAAQGKIFFRNYAVVMKKSGTKVPKVDLQEVGPRIDFTLRRTKSSSSDVQKHAFKQPRHSNTEKKRKNIEVGAYGDTEGRVHMQKQDLSEMALKKFKALKKRKNVSDDEEEPEGGSASQASKRAKTQGDEE